MSRHPGLADVAVEHEPAFARVHRSVDPLNGVGDAVVKQGQPIKARFDKVEQIGSRGSGIERATKQVALVH